MSQPLGLQVIDGAIKIFERPNSWVRREHAVNFFGMPVDPDSRWARRFCIHGALMRSSQQYGGTVALHQAIKLVEMERVSYVVWNDNTAESQDDVLEFLKAVRARATARKTLSLRIEQTPAEPRELELA